MKRTKIGGRKRGTPNRLSQSVRQSIVDALAAAGGVNYLAQQANSAPAAFLTLVGKLLPAEVRAEIRSGAPEGLAQALQEARERAAEARKKRELVSPER